MKILIVILGLSFLANCTSSQTRRQKPVDLTPVTSGKSSTPRYEPLDVIERLELVSKFDGIGFHQTLFNPCDLGMGSSYCRNHYVSAINFQLLCRDSVGTTEMVTNSELLPLSNRWIKWKMGSKSGNIMTNGRGYGEIRLVSRSSNKNKRLIIISNNQTLGVRANQVRKIVLPGDWCD